MVVVLYEFIDYKMDWKQTKNKKKWEKKFSK